MTSQEFDNLVIGQKLLITNSSVERFNGWIGRFITKEKCWITIYFDPPYSDRANDRRVFAYGEVSIINKDPLPLPG